MRITGYADPWSVAPGERIRFHVSSDAARYRAEIVRLLHGDSRPGAPGLKEEPVPTEIDGEYEGRSYSYPLGSHVIVDSDPRLRLERGFTLAAWIFPTLPGRGQQGILTRWSSVTRAGYGLVINAQGAAALCLGTHEISSGVPLLAGRWYFVAASYEPATGTAFVIQQPFPRWPTDPTDTAVAASAPKRAGGDAAGPFVMAGWWSGEDDQQRVEGHYDGKIEAPLVFGAALSQEALAALAAGATPRDVGPLVAAWDLALDTPTDRVREISGSGLDGRSVNMPARGMTGHAWSGGEPAWTRAPETHGAIHFHSDDLEDCRWDVAFELAVPDGLRSGVYAARVSADGETDHIPFFVRPQGRRASAPILFLVPTNSYLAYANFQTDFAQERGVLGLYHFHADGSAVFYSSGRRPIVNMRPGALFRVLDRPRGAPHQLPADLYLVDWLTEKRLPFDVATDRDLHVEGEPLLSQYRVVLTGSHPEYWSWQMLDALEAYLGRGGRLMYLGGNGLIWNTTYDPELPHVAEVRRGGGSHRAATPGERYHSTTGELGGYWRERGRAPHRILGVGSIAQGFDRSSPYLVQPGGHDARAAWIFEGVDTSLPIGDFGLTLGGAAGFEIDAADDSYGTPPHALVIASATELPPTYGHQHPANVPGTDVDLSPPMRADMVYFETPNGGAVFSVGSIAYCGALSHAGYDNSVSRLTENVVRRFAELPR